MAATATVVPCPKCHTFLPEQAINTGAVAPCPACSIPIQVEVFPAFFKPVDAGGAGETILVEGEASCFYHPKKRATVPCASCGRFLCALCDVELKGEHICPACLQTGQKKGKLIDLENKRTLYDSAALSLALLPLVLMWPLTLITAPAAIVTAIYAWNKPSSIIARTRLRIYLAIFFALLEIAGWGAGLVFAFKS
jgi:hypothetical protein